MEFNVTDLASIISSIGFPIVACIYLVKFNAESDKRHREEIDKLRVSLDNNTRVMNKICAKLNIGGDDDEQT